MKKIALVAIPLLLVGRPALAGTEQGSGALSLSALVAEYSPAVKAAEKALLLKYLEGDAKAAHAPGKKINVNAELVTCRISDVDITAHSCELAFGAKKDTIKRRGRRMNSTRRLSRSASRLKARRACRSSKPFPILNARSTPTRSNRGAAAGPTANTTPRNNLVVATQARHALAPVVIAAARIC